MKRICTGTGKCLGTGPVPGSPNGCGTPAPSAETVSARQLAQLAGRDPGGFCAHRSGTTVHVAGPCSVALYPHESWQDLFVAHLEAGFFDRSPGFTAGS